VAGTVSGPTTYPEVVEGIRAAIAAYTQALDDGRTDDIVATFCPDGGCTMPGLGSPRGHGALREAYERWKPTQPQRHLVVNTLVTEWDDHEARATSDVILVVKDQPNWSIQAVGRYDDVLHRSGDATWRFHSRTATFVR